MVVPPEKVLAPAALPVRVNRPDPASTNEPAPETTLLIVSKPPLVTANVWLAPMAIGKLMVSRLNELSKIAPASVI